MDQHVDDPADLADPLEVLVFFSVVLAALCHVLVMCQYLWDASRLSLAVLILGWCFLLLLW